MRKYGLAGGAIAGIALSIALSASAGESAYGAMMPSQGQAIGAKDSTTGKMQPLKVDGTGALVTTSSGTSGSNPSVSNTGIAAPGYATEIGWIDGGGILRPVTTNYPLPITGSISASNPSTSATGGGLPTQATFIGGTDAGTFRGVTVNSSGRLQVDVVSGGGSNASVGTTGSTAPTSATEIGGPDASGNLRAPTTRNDLPGATDYALSVHAISAPNTTSGSITGNGQTVTFTTMTQSDNIGVLITGSWTGTIAFEGSPDGSTWGAYETFNPIVTSESVQSTTTTNGFFQPLNMGGVTQFRVRSTAWTSGTATIFFSGTRGGDGMIKAALRENGALSAGYGIAVAGSDGTNHRYLSTDSSGRLNANVIAAPTTTVQGSVTVGGTLFNNNGAPVGNNVGALTAVATAAAPTYNEGRLVTPSVDLSGSLRVTATVTSAPTTTVQGTVTVQQGTAANLRAQTASEGSTGSATPSVAGLAGWSDGGSILRPASTAYPLPTTATVTGSLTPSDTTTNPTTAVPVGAFTLGWNGGNSNWERIRTSGTNTDGEAASALGTLDVDGHMRGFNGGSWDRLRSAGNNADGVATESLGVLKMGGYLYGYNGTTFDRVRVANTGRLQIDVLTMPTTTVVGSAQRGVSPAGVANALIVLPGAVSASAPTYTAGNVEHLSLTTAGAVRTDGSATTQPVSGTVSVSTTSTASASNTGTCSNVSTSTTVLASNASRRVAVVLNNGTANVHLKLGATATTSNPPLQPGQSFTIEGTTVYTGVVDVIASTGTQSVCSFEW